MKYPGLYQSLETLILEVLQVIRKQFGENPTWPGRQVWDVKFDGQRDQPFQRWQEYPEDTVYELMDKIFELPSLKTAVAEFEKFKDPSSFVQYGNCICASHHTQIFDAKSKPSF